LSGDFAWNGSTGDNVATLHKLALGDGDVLTLTGDANTYFIFNIQKRVSDERHRADRSRWRRHRGPRALQ
jgi:hypothetical protein